MPDAILFQLALRGRVRPEHLVAATGASAGEVDGALVDLAAEGLVVRERADGGAHVLPSVLGRQRAIAIAARESSLLRPAVAALDAEFAALNRRLKEILLRWQLRTDRSTEVLNDHADPRYDALVLAELRALHVVADQLLARLEPLRVRYGSLRQRLREALARATSGDRSAVAGVLGDSFHSAWWELHGDLLAILGRARGAADL